MGHADGIWLSGADAANFDDGVAILGKLCPAPGSQFLASQADYNLPPRPSSAHRGTPRLLSTSIDSYRHVVASIHTESIPYAMGHAVTWGNEPRSVFRKSGGEAGNEDCVYDHAT